MDDERSNDEDNGGEVSDQAAAAAPPDILPVEEEDHERNPPPPVVPVHARLLASYSCIEHRLTRTFTGALPRHPRVQSQLPTNLSCVNKLTHQCPMLRTV
jgi:hypothetical protein